ncbi:MAG: nuclear transport factor 2 family protein [Thermoanaerobaculia bacterium]
MKRTSVLAILFFVAAAAAGPAAGRAIAQGEDPRPDDEIVRALDDEERLAALKRDRRALERLWSDQFIVNAPNNRVVIGKQAVLDEFVAGGAIHFSAFERRIEFIRVDGDFAFVMGAETVKPRTGPSAGQLIQRRFTNVWRKEAGTWRLYARHANVIPKS